MTLRAEDVRYVYGEGTAFECAALDGISLDVAPGQLVLVLGRTGSGKSTLLRVLAGLIDPTGGRVRVDGEALFATAARRLVGIVFQDPEAQLFADSVLEDVMFAPRNLGRSSEQAVAIAEAALRRVGLDPEEFAMRSPFALSGGEARRAAIAGVLAMEPSYLLLDEPTAGLDLPGRRAVALVVETARREAGVVVVSHDPEQWLGSADRVLVLDDGRSSFCGATAEVLADPEIFGRAGLRPPEVLRAWQLAVRRGLPAGEPTLDPALLAERLVPLGKARP